MGLPQQRTRFTVEEYLAIERESEERHEFVDGEIYAMAGESPDHGAICVNLTMTVGTQLRGTRCQAFVKDTKVRSGSAPLPDHSTKGLFSYPDLLVVCGTMKFHDQARDVLLNPTVIVEVLSKSTETFDCGEKFRSYRTWLPTLKDCLLVAQGKPWIDQYRRMDENRWELVSVEGLAASLRLDSINCTLALADVYERVAFPAGDQP